jgi:hypothetical protein
MRAWLCFLLIIGAARPIAAQRDSSLTRDFAKLSAKERSRIAREEQDAAAADAQFQSVMAEAEALFAQQRYEAALARYQEARRLRPYNVFPKVKIQDLEALIARQAKEQAGTVDPLDPPKPDPPARLVAQPEPALAAPSREPVPAPKAEPLRAEPAPNPSDWQERSWLEGRAVVLERVRTVEGHTETYRRVSHPWGQVVHFREGLAITEREWLEAFGGR